jgi:hypothetical protein
VIDATVVVESGFVSAGVRMEGSEHEKDQVDEQLTMDVSASRIVPDAKKNPS